MSTPFIPTRDAELDMWLLNFSTLIDASPTSYGLLAADATIIKTAVDACRAAYATATAPITRTGPTIVAKDEAKAVAVGVVRGYAATIRANPAVAEHQRVALGLRLPRRGQSRATVPLEPPLLGIVGVDLGGHSLIAKTPHSDTARKPEGVAGLLVVRAIGDGPISDPAQAQLLALSTRARFESRFASEDGGKVATYFARWTNARGQPGPWSAPASMRIAA